MGVMEISARNAIFKGFSRTLGLGLLNPNKPLLDSQTTNKETNIFQSNFLKGFYLVPKCIKKKKADKSAIDTAMGARAKNKHD